MTTLAKLATVLSLLGNLLLLAGCDPVSGVQQYDPQTGAYYCPAGAYPDLDDHGQQICRRAR